MTQARLELLADSSGIRTATNDLKNLERQSGATESKTKKSFSSFGSSVGRAGIQIQQFVGQVQGGQNAMLALSAQSTDLGIVLGYPLIGVIAGLGAALAGSLAPALFGGKDAVDELEKASKKLGLTLTEAGDGSNILSESIRKLAERSSSLARVQIATSIQDIGESTKVAISGITDELEVLEKISNRALTGYAIDFTDTLLEFGISSEAAAKGLGDIAEAAERGFSASAFGKIVEQVTNVSREFGINRDQAVRLRLAFDAFDDDKGIKGVTALQRALEDLGDETNNENQKIRQLTAKLLPYFNAATEGVDNTNLLRLALDDLNGALQESSDVADGTVDAQKRLLQQLEVARIGFVDGELASRKYAVALSLGRESFEELDEEVQKAVVNLFNLEQARKNDADATKQQTQANREFIAALVSGLQEEQRVRQAFFSLQNQLAAENNPAEQARQQLQARLDVIREFYGLESNEQALQYAAGVDAEKSYQDQLAKIRKTGADQYQQQQISTLGYTSQFFGTLAQIAEAGGKDSFDSYKVLASAQAGIAAAMAVLQVYADPSITNTYLKIGLAGAIAGLAGAQIKQIQGAEYSGARALGGQVIGGNSYLVGERGPEVITAGSNGNVTPFNQLMSEAREGSASPNFSVNIVNNGSAMVETSQPRFSQEDRAWVLDVFVSDMDRRGRSFGAIKRNTTASGRTI